jgi:hypothetical protein
VEDFIYLGTTLTNKKSIREEIKSRLKAGNAGNSVQNLLSSGLLSKILKFNINRNIILFVVLYGCETWSLILRVFVNGVLRKIFGPKRDEGTREWRKLHKEELNNL